MMDRIKNLCMIAACTMILAGCNEEFQNESLDDRAAGNSWIVQSYYQDMIDAAIVTESTIYPHHFVKYGSTLNELGQRDVLIIARHFRDNPGRLNVRQAGTAGDLYTSRVQVIQQALAAHGVDQSRIVTEDRYPGGEGVGNERALLILERGAEKRTVVDSSDNASITSN